MKRHVIVLILLIVVAGVFPVPAIGPAQAEGAASDIYQVELAPGQDFDMCRSGEIVCPAKAAICDDLKIAVPVDLPSGLGFRGVNAGTTLCSAASAIGPRRVFRITVR